MGQITVQGLDKPVQIQGDVPTSEEADIILRAVEKMGVKAPAETPAPVLDAPPTEAEIGDALQPATVRPQLIKRTEPTVSRVAREKDIGFEGVGIEDSFKAGFGRSPEEALGLILKGRYGKETEVQREPETGKLIYRKPHETKFNFVGNDRELADLVAITGEILPLLGAVGGGVAGGAVGTAATGGPWGMVGGAAVGESVGTLVGEYTRLRAGKAMGAVPEDLTDIDLFYAATPPALIALGGSAGTAMAFTLYKRLASRHAPANLTIEQFEQAWAQAEAKLAGTGIKPTTGQAMEGTVAGDVMLGQQNALQGRLDTSAGRAVAEFTDEQLAGLGRQGMDMTPPIAPAARQDVTMSAGAQLRAIAQGEAAAAIEVPEIATARAREAATRSYQEAIRGPKRLPEQTGAVVKRGLADAKAAFNEVADTDVYGPVRAAAAGLSGRPSETINAVQSYQKKLDDALFPSLAEEDKGIVTAFLDRMKKGESATYEQVDDALKAVRRAKRDSAGSDEMLSDLNKALTADRASIVATRPEIAEQLAAADKWYRKESNLFDSTVIADLLTTEGGRLTRPMILDSEVFDRVMANPENARLVHAALKRPGNETEHAQMQNAIRQKWMEVADPEGNGVVNIAAHGEFMKSYGAQIKAFFGPDEAARFDKPGQMYRALAAREAALQKMSSDFAATPIGKIANVEDASAVFATTWKPGSPEMAQVTANLLTRFATYDDAPLTAYRALVRSDLADAVVKEAGGRQYVDIAAMDKYLADYGSQIRTVLGEVYHKNVLAVREAAEVVSAQGRTSIEANAKPWLYHVMRAAAGLNVAANRSITAAERRLSDAAAEKIKNLIVDPDEMRRVLKMRDVTAGEFATMLGVGATAGAVP